MDRSAGVLLHPTSLPSRHGIGDLGPEALRYVGWLADAGLTWWQVLPLHPPGYGDSPYAAISTFGGNELLISPEGLIEDGLLEPDDLRDAPAFPTDTVAFETVAPWKERLLLAAFERPGDAVAPPRASTRCSRIPTIWEAPTRCPCSTTGLTATWEPATESGGPSSCRWRA